MTENDATRRRVVWSVLVVLGPVLVLYLLAAATGGDLGTVELTILPILLLSIWIVGLSAIWWPRGHRAAK
jgi:hypothetical protein